MAVRRVVTGHDDQGRSVVVADQQVEPITTALIPGYATHEVWKSDELPTVPATEPARAAVSYYPPVDGVRFQVLVVPPAGTPAPEGVDVELALAELERAAPGIMDPQEPDNPGMHATDTVDFVYIASGEVTLELDGGQEVILRAGDTNIQQGNRHAWRNCGDQPAVVVGVALGARRRP